MKDYLNRSAWWNRAPRNRTQTFYTRFLKGPDGALKSQFTDSQDAFKRFGENALKTHYLRDMGA